MSTQFEEKHVLACNFPRHVTKFQGKVTVKITHHLDIIFTGGHGGRKSALMWCHSQWWCSFCYICWTAQI